MGKFQGVVSPTTPSGSRRVVMVVSWRPAGKYFAGVGVAIFGGTASYLLVWLQSMNASWIFPVYVAVLSVLSIVFYVLARQKNDIFIGS
ncbi:hypothetical protein ABH924_002459 [Arthrobacter sp. GAS37]